MLSLQVPEQKCHTEHDEVCHDEADCTTEQQCQDVAHTVTEQQVRRSLKIWGTFAIMRLCGNLC